MSNTRPGVSELRPPVRHSAVRVTDSESEGTRKSTWSPGSALGWPGRIQVHVGTQMAGSELVLRWPPKFEPVQRLQPETIGSESVLGRLDPSQQQRRGRLAPSFRIRAARSGSTELRALTQGGRVGPAGLESGRPTIG